MLSLADINYCFVSTRSGRVKKWNNNIYLLGFTRNYVNVIFNKNLINFVFFVKHPVYVYPINKIHNFLLKEWKILIMHLNAISDSIIKL